MTSVDHTSSPFHEGEERVQARQGVLEKVAAFGSKLIRDHLIDQHREFYAQLPFLLLGTVDGRGRPWASIVSGEPGFLSTPNDTTLQIAAQPLEGDPLSSTLTSGAPIGVLGLQLETRRRNRMTGHVQRMGADGFSIAVDQSFGNCPRFIQTRQPIAPQDVTAQVHAPETQFSEAVHALIARADTLFVASAYAPDASTVAHGADVSHRGGKPGFVRIEDERSFIFPDFSGNNIFNTVGNLLLNPKAGFLFPDFETGDLVYMTGTTEIIWDGPEVEAFTGAERLIRFKADEIIHVERGLPVRFSFDAYAPNLKATGEWAQSAD
ncbi:MAG: pyridoxamine 5'-phosphate oxidase family protein [Pseudomonadota bacterium]